MAIVLNQYASKLAKFAYGWAKQQVAEVGIDDLRKGKVTWYTKEIVKKWNEFDTRHVEAKRQRVD